MQPDQTHSNQYIGNSSWTLGKHKTAWIVLNLTVSPESFSTRMSTTTSRDQFEPIRCGDNLMVNYNRRYLTTMQVRSVLIMEHFVCFLYCYF